jgi:hypothetical protein
MRQEPVFYRSRKKQSRESALTDNRDEPVDFQADGKRKATRRNVVVGLATTGQQDYLSAAPRPMLVIFTCAVHDTAVYLGRHL